MNRKHLFILLTVLFSVVVFFLRKQLFIALTPFVIGGIFYYILRPFVGFTSDILASHIKIKNERTLTKLSLLLVVTVMLGIIFLLVKFLLPDFSSEILHLANSLPKINNHLELLLSELISYISSMGISHEISQSITDALYYLTQTLIGYINKIANQIPLLIQNTFNIVSNFFAGILISYYLIIDPNSIQIKFLKLFSTHRRITVMKKLKKVDAIISSFLQGQLLIALIIGILETLGLMLLGIKNSMLLGIFGGISNLIPYIGPIIGVIPALIIGLIYSPDKILFILLLFIGVQQLDNTFITPKIIERHLGINPLMSIFVVLLGGELYGLIGMIFAVPITAIIKSALE